MGFYSIFETVIMRYAIIAIMFFSLVVLIYSIVVLVRVIKREIFNKT